MNYGQYCENTIQYYFLDFDRIFLFFIGKFLTCLQCILTVSTYLPSLTSPTLPQQIPLSNFMSSLLKKVPLTY